MPDHGDLPRATGLPPNGAPAIPGQHGRGVPTGIPVQLLGSKYAGVISEYLGDYGNMPVSCPLHGYGYTEETGEGGVDPIVQNTLIPDAQQLLQSAGSILTMLDPASMAYQDIQNAMYNLQNIINGAAPTTSEVAGAMGQLTQAMANAQ